MSQTRDFKQKPNAGVTNKELLYLVVLQKNGGALPWFDTYFAFIVIIIKQPTSSLLLSSTDTKIV